MDPMGGIVMTNDGNAILREVMETEIVLFYLPPLYWESIFLNVFFKFYVWLLILSSTQINVQHPAAKSMIEVARTQDEEVGDGTTSVIILGKRFNVNNHQYYLWQRVTTFLCIYG